MDCLNHIRCLKCVDLFDLLIALRHFFAFLQHAGLRKITKTSLNQTAKRLLLLFASSTSALLIYAMLITLQVTSFHSKSTSNMYNLTVLQEKRRTMYPLKIHPKKKKKDKQTGRYVIYDCVTHIFSLEQSFYLFNISLQQD